MQYLYYLYILGPERNESVCIWKKSFVGPYSSQIIIFKGLRKIGFVTDFVAAVMAAAGVLGHVRQVWKITIFNNNINKNDSNINIINDDLQLENTLTCISTNISATITICDKCDSVVK